MLGWQTYAHVSSVDVRKGTIERTLVFLVRTYAVGETTGRTPLSVVADVHGGTTGRRLAIVSRTL
jgi:hypothetical protein